MYEALQKAPSAAITTCTTIATSSVVLWSAIRRTPIPTSTSRPNRKPSLPMASAASAPSPLPAYILGAACVGRGLMAMLNPRAEYGHVGLPLEPPAQSSPSVLSTAADAHAHGCVSPLMYFKGLREMSYGLTLVALQHQGHAAALTTFAAILSLVRFGDGLVVYLRGGIKLRYRASGHWITAAGFVVWVLWRRRRS